MTPKEPTTFWFHGRLTTVVDCLATVPLSFLSSVQHCTWSHSRTIFSVGCRRGFQEKGAGVKGADGGTSKAAEPSADGGKGTTKAGGGESQAARASALVSRCQRLEQENEELAASADVAKGSCTCLLFFLFQVYLIRQW